MMSLPVDLVNEPCRVNKVTLANVPLELDNVKQATDYLNRLREENNVLFLRDIDLMEQTDTSVHWRGTVVGTLSIRNRRKIRLRAKIGRIFVQSQKKILQH